MSDAIVVGLTGPMGSGKTVVAKLFESNGYKIVDADVIARKVVKKGSATLDRLVEEFSDEIISCDGTLDRAALAKIAFASKENTDKLNSITHPAILELVKSEIKRFCAMNFKKIVYDAPLLFESGSDEFCDKIVTVIADVDERIERIKHRDNMSVDQIQNRIKSQQNDSFYIDKSDYVIYNNFSLDRLLCDAKKVIDELDEVYHGTL